MARLHYAPLQNRTDPSLLASVRSNGWSSLAKNAISIPCQSMRRSPLSVVCTVNGATTGTVPLEKELQAVLAEVVPGRFSCRADFAFGTCLFCLPVGLGNTVTYLEHPSVIIVTGQNIARRHTTSLSCRTNSLLLPPPQTVHGCNQIKKDADTNRKLAATMTHVIDKAKRTSFLVLSMFLRAVDQKSGVGCRIFQPIMVPK